MLGKIAGKLKTRMALASKGYLVRPRWKEECVYMEKGRSECLVFELPMGAAPYRVYVPTERGWTERAPDWAKDRRKIIMERLGELDGIGVVSDDDAAMWVERI